MWKQAPFYLSLVLASAAIANPDGPVVMAGKAEFSGLNSTTLNITASDKSVIHWRSFSIDTAEVTKFTQPSHTSCVLNRVTSGNPSLILGRLEGNGKIVLLNPNGLLVGKTGVINAAGFLATTFNLAEDDFFQEKDLLLRGRSATSIINLGTIQAWDGDVVLLATSMENRGEIQAPKGVVAIGVGREILLMPKGKERIFIRPKETAPSSTITNDGFISALSAELKAEGNPYALAINQSGVIEALSVMGEGGRILLVAEKGNIKVNGSISSSGQEIFLSADNILLSTDGEAKTTLSLLQKEGAPRLTLFAREGITADTQTNIATNGTLLLTTKEEDVCLCGNIKTQGDGTIEIRSGQDVRIGGRMHLHPCRIDSQTGPINIKAERDFYLTASPMRSSQINTGGGNIFIECGRDGFLTGGEETTARAYAFSKGNLSFVAGRHLFLKAQGPGYAALGSAHDTTVVVDNLFSTPPEVGVGALYMDKNTRLQGDTLRIFTARQSQNTIEGVLNLVPFIPGNQYAPSPEEAWGTYFSTATGNGNLPFTIYYKDVWVNPSVTELFNIATTEFLQDLKDFDDFYYIQRLFSMRYDRAAYSQWQLKDALISSDVLPDRTFRYLRKTYKNSLGRLYEIL